MEFEHQILPSGQTIIRERSPAGLLIREQHTYGTLAIGISFHFEAGVKTEELYFVKRRMVGRRAYEKARAAYPDMPPADETLEDESGRWMTDLRKEQKLKKIEAEQRLATSAESRFPRPPGTNWLRVISDAQAHLVEFTSRDWKILSREANAIPTGLEWFRLFGFDGPPDKRLRSVAYGLVVGYEVQGDRQAMLDASRKLLEEVRAYTPPTKDPTWCNLSVRKKPKPRKPKPIAWPSVLPPLITFLEGLDTPTVTIYNHHQ